MRMLKPEVVQAVPGELLHRTASYVIIAEGVFHTFNNRLILVVVAGIVFIAVEVVALGKFGQGDRHSFDS